MFPKRLKKFPCRTHLSMLLCAILQELLGPADVYLRLVGISRLKRAVQPRGERKEMRLFTRSLAAATLTAGCYLSIPMVNVPAQSPPPGPSTSAPDLSD